MSDSEIVDTHNGFGWTSTVPNQITEALVEWLGLLPQPAPLVLDIGAGLGVGTLPLLAAGANVIAFDLEESHLAIIRQEAGSKLMSDRLTTVVGRFPGSLQFKAIDAIHCSNVLHFLSGLEIEEGARRMREWLRPEGRVFLQVGTVYAGHIKGLLPVFEERRKCGVKWAGETDQARFYVAPDFQHATPMFMNYLDEAPLVEAFQSTGFRVDRAWYYTRHGLPATLKNDGREHFGLVATLPR